MKILIPITLAFLIAGCSDTPSNTVETTSTTTGIEEKKVEPEALKEESKPQPTTTPTPVVEEKKAQPQVLNKESKVQPVTPKKESASKAVTPPTPLAASEQKDGASIYTTCGSCHGADASKAALGKSQIIKGWSAKKIADALHGYKDGTYGAATKAIMVGQVSKLSDQDIEAVSQHIAKF